MKHRSVDSLGSSTFDIIIFIIEIRFFTDQSDYDLHSVCAVGVNLFYVAMVLYLYGDLAIYAVAVPKSLRDVAW